MFDDSMLYPVQESDRERVKELEAMAKKLASEEDFENAESVQQEANSLHKNIKNSMNSIEEVSSCYKDAKACYNMYTQRKQYRMAGEWNNVVIHLETRLAPYLKHIESQLKHSSGKRTRSSLSSSSSSRGQVEDDNNEDDDEEEEEEEDEDEPQQQQQPQGGGLQELKHEASRDKSKNSRELSENGKRQRGVGRGKSKKSQKTQKPLDHYSFSAKMNKS